MLNSSTAQQPQCVSLFDIIEQFNKGRSQITTAQEQIYLAELNQQAAEKAKAACVWDAVVRYSAIGLSLLPKKHWQSHYQLSFKLYFSKAEGEYLCGRPDESDQLYDELLARCDDSLVKADICTTRLVENIGRGRWHLGIEFALQGLKYLNISFPTDEPAIKQALIQEQAVFNAQIKETPIHKIEQLPEMSDKGLLIAVKIWANVSPCAFLLSNTTLMNLSVLRGLNCVLSAGKSDLIVSQLAWHAVSLAQRGEYKQGIVMADKAIKLANLYSHIQELANSYNVLAAMVLPFKEPYKVCSAQHQKGYETGLENGEIARAIINFNNILILNYAKGDHLHLVQKHAEASQTLNRRKAVFVPVSNNIVRLVMALTEPDDNAAKKLDDEAFSPDYLKKIKGTLHESALLYYRAELAFWYGEQEKSLEIAHSAHDMFVKTPKFCCYMDHLTQYGLLLASQSAQHPEKYAKNFAFCLHELKNLADFCPENFDHKYQLLLAEQGRYHHDTVGQAPMDHASIDKVMGYYTNAITSAKEQGFLQYQALANERLALFLQEQGLSNIATAYIDEAIMLYQHWGCEARIVYLKNNYNHLITLKQSSRNTGAERVLSERSASVEDSELNSDSEDKTGLDFDTVMKSSQLISSELKLKQLALKVMQVIAESAGAQTAALVLNTKNGPCVEARVSSLCDSSESSGTTLQAHLSGSQALEQCNDLPLSIISYVLRTDKIVNMADISGANFSNKAFKDDPYLKAQTPESILCIPVDYRDKIIGVLYLENRLTAKAFTESRLNVIKMLLSQTAISIENARLFEEVNSLNQGLEQKVNERTQQLSESNTALQTANEELKSFSYSVSHDLRSPLRSIKGFSQILLDEYADKLDDMGESLLQRIMAGSSKMAELINGLLELSRVQQRDIKLNPVNLSKMAQDIADELNDNLSSHPVIFTCAPNIEVQADARMLYSAMENLLNNAWKYSSKMEQAIVEFGVKMQDDQAIYFIKDNGSGFDMAHAHHLFGTFQRLHTEKEFSGTGIGLATVKRIINKHKGEIWAEAEVDKGATFYFTL